MCTRYLVELDEKELKELIEAADASADECLVILLSESHMSPSIEPPFSPNRAKYSLQIEPPLLQAKSHKCKWPGKEFLGIFTGPGIVYSFFAGLFLKLFRFRIESSPSITIS